jgi:hypothetical protein
MIQTMRYLFVECVRRIPVCHPLYCFYPEVLLIGWSKDRNTFILSNTGINVLPISSSLVAIGDVEGSPRALGG